MLFWLKSRKGGKTPFRNIAVHTKRKTNQNFVNRFFPNSFGLTFFAKHSALNKLLLKYVKSTKKVFLKTINRTYTTAYTTPSCSEKITIEINSDL